VIMDFGLAHSVEVRTSGPRGTLHYIAPEVWKGEDATAASDVYSLGVVLYEMLTGRMPYPSGTDWKTRLSKLPEAPSRTERKPDARWDPIVLGCLRQDPAQRFPSAAAVSQAIEDAFGGAKRRRLLIAAAILVATLAPVALFRDAIWPPPMARLALLPLAGSTGDVALDSVVRGGLLEVAGRLESLGAESRRLALIPVEESVRHEVKAPGLAAARLGATHVLASEINPKGTAIELRASVVDARTGEVLRNFSGEFQGSDILGVSTSLAAVVTSAFRLKKAPPATMAATAYPHYARGLATIRQQRALFDPAIESFQKALTIDANSPAVQSALANAYLEKFQATNEARWLEEASKLARRAETLHPDTPEVLLVRGRVEELEGRPERGIEFFKRAAELEPNNSEAWRRTGTALQALGRDAEAVSALRRSIELDPGYYNPHLTLGQVHLRAGRYLQAAEEFREAARLAPELPEAYSHLGAGLVLAERLPEAEQALRKSIQLRETRAALNNLSVLLRYQDRHSEAVQVLERALKVGVDSTPLRLNLGNALLRIGRAQDAKVHFTRASELARSTLLRDPRDAVARAQWAHTLVRLGSPSLAADEARQAMRLGSTQYSVLFNSVMTMEALGRREEALAFASEASTEQLKDLRRQPDLAEFSRDPRFLKLIEARGSQSNNANKE
jgi:tetratricopeptide (TPR) repeat protein